MTVATVNGSAVIRGRVHLQRVGVWFADLAVDRLSLVTGAAEVVFGDGALVLRGTATRTGTFQETAILRVVPGAGGLPLDTKPKFWRNIPARTVLGDILSQVGERLADDCSQAVDQQLTAHCQTQATTAAALAALSLRVGCLWRSKPDGSVWVGRETWPEVEPPGESVAEDPRAASEAWGVEAPTVFPGMSINGRRVSVVEHQVGPSEIRTVVWYETGDDASGTAGDRRTKAIRSLVDHFTAPLDYYAVRTATVVRQKLDGRLELRPSDPAWPNLTDVPIRYGLPGVKATILPGARVGFTFEDGDPAAAVAVIWDRATILEVAFDPNPGQPAAPLARAMVDTAGPYPIVGGNQRVKG